MSDKSSVSLEVNSGNTLQVLRRVLNIVSLTDDLEGARIELEFSGNVPISDGLEGVEKVEEPEESEEPEPEEEEKVIEGVKASNVPTITTDSEAYHVLRALRERDSPLHTPEIRELMRQEYDIGKTDSVSKTLWSLADRGMVDKQPSDRDGRMKKYCLTSKGRAALEVVER